MTFAAVTLLGMTLGQPQGPDIYPMNSRTIKLPIEYKKDNKRPIRHVLLYVARNRENTWYQEGLVTPDKDSFVYLAREDGEYWFKMVIEYMNGVKDPPDLTRDPPDLKVVVDTAPPVIRVTNAKRSGEEIVIEWGVDDKFLNDAQTKVEFCVTGDPVPQWRSVRRPPNVAPTERFVGVTFKSGTAEGITVRITASDIAGNSTQVTKDFPAVSAGQTTTALSMPAAPTPAPTPPVIPPPPPQNVIVPIQNQNNTGAGPVAPQPPADVITAGPGPVTPAGPPVTPQPSAPVAPPAPPQYPPPAPQPPIYTQPAYPANGNSSTGGTAGSGQPLATIDPKDPPAPVPAAQGAAPAGGWTGPTATAEAPRAQVINYPRFDLSFDLEQHGPSGIGRVDLFVTRDEGKSWYKWKEYDGKGVTVRVVLDAPTAPQPLEGSYGFRLVPVSGAGLSESAPAAGTAPELRVILDVTPPQVQLFKLEPDPKNPDCLIIKWIATDRNLGEDPITLEWSESTTGPWHPIAYGGNEPVVQATALNAPVAPKRLANTGSYSWRVPAGTPARVYLKVTARDAAGNVTERVTQDPQTVDLTKPRAKISGIMPPTPQHP